MREYQRILFGEPPAMDGVWVPSSSTGIRLKFIARKASRNGIH